jgi:hypothetical protein
MNSAKTTSRPTSRELSCVSTAPRSADVVDRLARCSVCPNATDHRGRTLLRCQVSFSGHAMAP